MTTRVATILQGKGRDVFTVRPEASIASLVRTLAERRIGAVPVVDEAGKLIGIVSERDVVRALASDPVALERPIGSVMTREVKTCTPDDAVIGMMEVMTRGRMRHLPVLENDRLIGIISIGDVVKQRLDEAQFELDALRSYIAS
jgi:CBS domain-containing protein